MCVCLRPVLTWRVWCSGRRDHHGTARTCARATERVSVHWHADSREASVRCGPGRFADGGECRFCCVAVSAQMCKRGQHTSCCRHVVDHRACAVWWLWNAHDACAVSRS